MNERLDRLASRSEFCYDILKLVSEPLDSVVSFKSKTLHSLFDNLSTNHYEFGSYVRTADRKNPLMLCNTVALNVESVFWDLEWEKKYFDTCIYNPNKNPMFLGTDKNAFVIKDFMSYSDYEKNVNFIELLRKHGYYYSCVVFFKNKKQLLGQITLLRTKEEGDFSTQDLAVLEQVAPFIRNRLLDYKALRNEAMHRDLFFELVSGNKEPVMLLDANYRLISRNEAAKEICGEMTLSFEVSDFQIQNIVDTLLMHRMDYNNYFKVDGKNHKEYFVSVKQYRLAKENAMDKVYLVYLNRDGFVMDRKAAPTITPTGVKLSNRQMEIIQLIAEGKSNGEIAQELLISEHTVKKHVENIRTELGVSNRVAILNKLHIV